MEPEIVFTPSGLLDLLLQIDELADRNITISENDGSKIILKIDDSTYDIDTSRAAEISVDSEAVNDVADINDTTYQELESELGVELSDTLEPVESGPIKELIKTLFIGGMARLTVNALKK